jgi:hypothetical protein
MFERERTDQETDIDFDFFDDSPTTETAREGTPLRRRRPRLPTRPPAGGAPLLRMAALIVGGILLVVILILWLSSCLADRKTAEYRDYMRSAARVGADSEQVGRSLNELVFTPGIQVEDLQNGLDGLRQDQSQIVQNAERLDAPGPLREQHESLIEALQLRVSGLNGLARGLTQITDATGADAAGDLLAEQSNRLVASDVLWADYFMAPAQEVMEEQDIGGVEVPDSNFVANTEFSSPNSWTLIVERLTQPPAAGGLHGNRIAAVRALPGEEELSRTDENTVQASDRLAFEVIVENSGDNQETQVKVNLTIQQSPQPIRKEATIDAINPEEAESVVFRDLGQVSFGPRTILKVTVEPVPGEENTNNNTAEYVVIFTFGP